MRHSHLVLMKSRCRSSRYHQAQSEWLLHRCCGRRRCSSHHVTGSADVFQSVHAATRRMLLKVKGFSEVKVEKIKEAIAKLQVSSDSLLDLDRRPSMVNRSLLMKQPSASGFITAVELGHNRRRVCKISTGSKQLDSILGGRVCQSRTLISQWLRVCQWVPEHEYQ